MCVLIIYVHRHITVTCLCTLCIQLGMKAESQKEARPTKIDFKKMPIAKCDEDTICSKLIPQLCTAQRLQHDSFNLGSGLGSQCNCRCLSFPVNDSSVIKRVILSFVSPGHMAVESLSLESPNLAATYYYPTFGLMCHGIVTVGGKCLSSLHNYNT